MTLKIQTKIPNEKHPNWYDRHILKMYETMYGTMTSETALAETLWRPLQANACELHLSSYLI